MGSDSARTEEGPAFRATSRLRATLWLLGGFWTFWWAALTFYWWVAGAGETVADAIRRIPIMMLGAGLCFLLASVLKAMRHRSFLVRAVTVALLLLPVSFVYAAVSVSVFQGLSALAVADDGGLTEAARQLFLKVVRWTPSFISCAAMVLALEYAFDIRDREARIAELAAAAHRAELAALRFQVNPHFLFNSLNSAVSLVVTRRLAEAEQLLLSLATFLRSTLAQAPLDHVSLAGELALQEAYLEVESVRFPDRLRFVREVTPEAEAAQVPSLILQPLIENALKHGVGRSAGITTVELRADVEGGRLRVVVENDAPSADARPGAVGLGLGLANVRRRLEAAYGRSASFEAGPRAGGGFRVRFSAPYVPAPD